MVSFQFTMVSDGSTARGGTEALISYWLSIGLGSVSESVERTLDRLFQDGAILYRMAR